tara:strand:- start:590 stop:979 length:390 start_codon:yes stop_codon:yes gene_type:complete
MDSRTYLWLGYTVIAVVVFLTLFSTIARQANVDSREDFISADLSWFEQVLFVSNNELELSYLIGRDYNVLFEKPCSVSVSKIGSPVFAGAKFFCAPNHYDSLIYPEEVLSSEEITILKEQDSLEVLSDE